MTYTYPGVYVQELTSPVHAISGVATSITAFVGYTPRGIDGQAQAIFSFADFQRLYGGLASDSELSYAVAQFYQNAPGAQAYVVRVPKSGDPGTATVVFGGLTFTALSSGAWANNTLLIDVDQGAPVDLTADSTAFNLTVTNLADGTSEYFPRLSLDATRANYVVSVINNPDNGSRLVGVAAALAAPPVPLTASGVVGTAIDLDTFSSAVSNTADSKPTWTAKDDYGFVLNVSHPASLPGLTSAGLPVSLFAKDAPLPQSLTGIASTLQRAIAAALATALPGASVQCSLTTVSPGVSSAPASGSASASRRAAASDSTTPPSYGQALRITVMIPGWPDAVLSLADPTAATGTTDAIGSQPVLGALGLSGNPSVNVAHYTLGSGNGSGTDGNKWGGAQSASVAAATDVTAPTADDLATAISALDKVELFNLLSIPDATRTGMIASDVQSIYSVAVAYCAQRRAFLLVDPPDSVTTVAGAVDWISGTLGITDPNGAAYWPRVRLPDPLNGNNLRTFAPSGVVAGVYAATDGARGVWKAPAGISATLNGVQSLSYQLTDAESGELNPLGLNCLRSFPVYGRVLWGARTLQGADALASQWKYVPVRRLALYLEESLYQGLKWVVFEPNDAPLWAAIRLNVESFLDTLFRKGAFAGTTATQAYFVKCDSETTTPADISNGIVNVVVGFAPLEPAEFVVIQLEQLAGQG